MQRRETSPPWLAAYHIPGKVIGRPEGREDGGDSGSQEALSCSPAMCISFHNLEGMEFQGMWGLPVGWKEGKGEINLTIKAWPGDYRVFHLLFDLSSLGKKRTSWHCTITENLGLFSVSCLCPCLWLHYGRSVANATISYVLSFIYKTEKCIPNIPILHSFTAFPYIRKRQVNKR